MQPSDEDDEDESVVVPSKKGGRKNKGGNIFDNLSQGGSDEEEGGEDQESGDTLSAKITVPHVSSPCRPHPSLTLAPESLPISQRDFHHHNNLHMQPACLRPLAKAPQPVQMQPNLKFAV